MTHDEIMAMKPGRELDALVAKKIFGVNNPDARWSPSTEISAAFEAETKVIEKDPSMYVHALASVVFGYSQVQDISDIRKMCMLIHATSEQRCKAALLAVMGL